MEPIQGIVAFLDVLGYQNFIDNNSVGKAVEILTNVFTGLKEASVEDYKTRWVKPGVAAKRRFEDVFIQTLSDSIIFHFQTPKGSIPISDWMTFLQIVRVTQRRLFDNGFPARGAVACGQYYFRDGFLVGRPFMEAYRLTQSLEFAGVVLTAEASTRMKGDFKNQNVALRGFAGGVDFLVPMKENREGKFYCLCPLRLGEIQTEILSDVAELVYQSFWQHQKDVPANVDLKITNTIKFWRYWVCRNVQRLPRPVEARKK
jgi:hypothetical protein